MSVVLGGVMDTSKLAMLLPERGLKAMQKLRFSSSACTTMASRQQSTLPVMLVTGMLMAQPACKLRTLTLVLHAALSCQSPASAPQS